jgi:hypothetical protein
MGRPRREVTALTELKLEKIVRWQLLDQSTAQIAANLGCSEDSVQEMIRHPKYREIRDRLVPQAFSLVDETIKTRKASQILDDASKEAAFALVELLQQRRPKVGEDGEIKQEGLNATDVRLTATAILDRAGFGPVQRKAIKQRIELDPVMAQMFAAAMREADKAKTVVDVEFEVDGE